MPKEPVSQIFAEMADGVLDVRTAYEIKRKRGRRMSSDSDVYLTCKGTVLRAQRRNASDLQLQQQQQQCKVTGPKPTTVALLS